jgi:DNA-binding CsgD family transcriptional regulator
MREPPWLLMRGVPRSAWSHAMRKGKQTAGRSSDSEISLGHISVSRNHAELRWDGRRLVVRDLNSRNGTFVNGRRVREAILGVGDVLRLGDVVIDVVSALKDLLLVSEVDTGQGEGAAAQPRNKTRKLPRVLSDAEERVYLQLLRGWPEKEIAEALRLSHHTVHAHVKSIYKLLGVRSRGELLAKHLAGMRDGKSRA